jgi:hypothetical protein
MVAGRSRSMLVLVQAVLFVLCVATGVVFAAWILGVNGLGLVSGAELPSPLRTSESNGVPSEAVLVHGKEGLATVAAANGVTDGLSGRVIQPGDGSSEFYGNAAFLSFWAPTQSQHAAWFAVRALPALGLVVIWWLLFRIVQDVRRGSGFNRLVARRLQVIGLLVLVGMPVLQFGRWAVAGWLVESSNAAQIADVPPLHLDVWPFAVGLVILVMASTWREAAGMREDLEGLV